MIRCAITTGAPPTDDPVAHNQSLLRSTQRWAADGIDYIQLREKSLSSSELQSLALAMLNIIRATEPDPRHRSRLLINSRADVAIAAEADGVHLTSHPDELTPDQVRKLFDHAHRSPPVISISCHNTAQVDHAIANKVDLILFGPVFEKRIGDKLVSEGLGLEALHLACTHAGHTPVLALGGITIANTQSCLHAGAAGIAAIRLFN
jgi:thiamine-phosphate pyrophosphorylase